MQSMQLWAYLQLGVATVQGPVRDVPPAQPFVPTRAHPEPGVLQWSDPESPVLWSPSWSVQCRDGGHSVLSPSVSSARGENSSPEAEGWEQTSVHMPSLWRSVPSGRNHTR